MTDKVKAVGWRLIIKPREISDKVGNIYLADTTKQQMGLSAVVGQVISAGQDIYAGDKFESRWCKVGDWVLIGKFAGMRFKVGQEEFRVINDDEVLAVVADPQAIQSA